MNKEYLFNKYIEILTDDEYDINKVDITESSSFRDLGLDSLDALDITFRLESEIKLNFSDDVCNILWDTENSLSEKVEAIVNSDEFKGNYVNITTKCVEILNAYINHKSIEYRKIDKFENWKELTLPYWDFVHYEYRIKC